MVPWWTLIVVAIVSPIALHSLAKWFFGDGR